MSFPDLTFFKLTVIFLSLQNGVIIPKRGKYNDYSQSGLTCLSISEYFTLESNIYLPEMILA